MGLREFKKANRSAHQDDLDPQDRYKVAKAVWPGLIEPSVFLTVQERLEKNAKTLRKYRHVYSYSSKAFCELCGESLVGKSATGKNKVYYYYGHNRKFTGKGDSHIKRCPLERIPALELEAAMLGRLRLLAKNPKLVAEIVRSSSQSKDQVAPNNEKLIALKKSEIADTKSKIANLADRIAGLPKDFPMDGLLSGLQTLESKKDAAVSGLKALEEEAKATNRLVDLGFVFRALQIFNRGSFDKLTPIEQRGLIDGFVHRITLGKNRIHAEYYGQANEDIFDWESDVSGGKKTKKNLEDPRTGVLPSIKLVEQAKTWKNRSKLLDSFEFNFNLNLIDRQVWADLYQIQGLSAAQIAQRYGAPKSTILSILHHHGLQCEAAKGRSTRADNYRAPIPPYGYKVAGGKLVVAPKERAVCELICALARAEKSWTEIAEELNRRQTPTRRAKSTWHRHTVKIIFQRWKDKL